ncbi:MAG: hypothetical protein JWM14_3134 [Chitinophagaceae bacterium]|nr:hypothetical protein [Chitinophagaceae bacterium]
MKSGYLIAILLLSIAGSCLGLLNYVFNDEYLDLFFKLSTTAFLFSGVYLLSQNGSYRYTRYYRWSALSITLVLIGTAFQIMHWPMAYAFSIIATLLFLSLYTIHFVHKPIKKELDWIKLIFVYAYFATQCIRSLHIPLPKESFFIPHFILAYALFLFFYKKNEPTPMNILDEE